MATKSMREVQNFAQNASAWLEANPKRTKLSYALTKMIKKLQPRLVEFSEAQEDANIEHCTVDEKTNAVLIADDRYQFTKEGMKAKNEAVRKLLRENVEFEPFFAPDPEAIGETLSEIEYSAFEGFVLPEGMEPEALPTVDEGGDVSEEGDL